MNQGALGGDLGNIIEYWAHENWVSFNARLTQLGIPKVAVDYGPGTHAWPNWQRALRARSMPQIMALFAAPPADPSVFWYRTTDPYAQRLRLDRRHHPDPPRARRADRPARRLRA